MKIAIVSDTHNNWKNYEKILNWLEGEGIQQILHCGDISSQEIIDNAQKKFQGDIKYVKGNADHGLEIPPTMELEIGGKKIGFAHFPNLALKLAESGKNDIVFYGHTHRPWEEKKGNCRFINPGEVAGQFFKPTFAMYDTETDKLELKILEKL